MEHEYVNSDNEWDFDEDELNLDDGNDVCKEQGTPASKRTLSKFEQELRSYILYLADPLIAGKINQMFQVQYNNPQPALQLCQYYYARPQLRSYTNCIR